MTFTFRDVLRLGHQLQAAAQAEQRREKRSLLELKRALAAGWKKISTKKLSARPAAGKGKGGGLGSWTSRGVVPLHVAKLARGGARGDSYAVNKPGARLLDCNMLGRTPEERIEEWGLWRAQHPRVAPEHMERHLIISRPPGVPWRNDAEILAFVREHLRQLGVIDSIHGDAAYCVILHDGVAAPGGNQHVHVPHSRAFPDGTLLNLSWERLKVRDALRRAEAVLGLPHEIPRPMDRPAAPGDRAVAAQRRAQRRATTPAWVSADQVRAAVASARDLDHLQQLLKEQQIEMLIARHADGKARGLLLRAQGSGEWLAATSISRDLSLQKVQGAMRQVRPAQSFQYPQPPLRERPVSPPKCPRERGG